MYEKSKNKDKEKKKKRADTRPQNCDRIDNNTNSRARARMLPTRP